jgi:hypothetical protein
MPHADDYVYAVITIRRERCHIWRFQTTDTRGLDIRPVSVARLAV